MSKKNFTDGLESLFAEHTEEILQRNPLLGYEARSGHTKEQEISSSNELKNQLESFLQENFSAGFTLEDVELSDPDNDKDSKSVKPLSLDGARQYTKPLSGLDLLIRDTVNYGDQPTLNLRRFTFFIDKSLLTEMKTVARQEGMYLKDLIIEVFNKYIDSYKQNKS